MIPIYVSTRGLVPAYKYNINSMVSLYVSASGLFPAHEYPNTEAFVKLKCRATSQEPRIKAGTLGQAIKETVCLVDYCL